MSRWADIPGWEGRYEVPDDGRVRSWWYGKKRLTVGRELKQKTDRYGYPVVCLRHKEVKKFPTVHRLVALAFLPNPYSKSQINHKNGVKTDNRVENLEWSTNAENIQHAFDMGLISRAKVSAGQQRRYDRPEERAASSQRMRGRKRVHKDNTTRMVSAESLPSLLREGWELGFITFRRS